MFVVSQNGVGRICSWDWLGCWEEHTWTENWRLSHYSSIEIDSRNAIGLSTPSVCDPSVTTQISKLATVARDSLGTALSRVTLPAPFLIPDHRSHDLCILLGRELTSEENIRGMLVSSLTAVNASLLDAFEGGVAYLTFRFYRVVRHPLTISGQQHVRLQVLVHPLGPFTQVPVDVATSGVVKDGLISLDPAPLLAAS
jgi:hypothetical protein